MGLKNPGIAGKSKKIPKMNGFFGILRSHSKKNPNPENPGIWDMGFGIPEKSHPKATSGHTGGFFGVQIGEEPCGSGGHKHQSIIRVSRAHALTSGR